MRLGFDLDGTLADMHSALVLEARRLFPDIDPAAVPNSTATDEVTGPQDQDADPKAEAADESLSIGALTARQQRELWKAVRARENFWESLDEIEPGALARLHSLVQSRRWELIFLTSRPETAGDTAQAQSHRWLSAHGYPDPSVFVVHGSRGKIAAALHLDVLVDDRPENCLDVAVDSTARGILVWRGDTGKVPGSASPGHWCGEFDEGVPGHSRRTRPVLGEPGMMDRLKRLLGLKPATARFNKPGRAEPSRRTTGCRRSVDAR
jgi:hypothetical protein